MNAGPTRKGWTLPLAIGSVLALYLGLLAYFAPPRVVLSKQPVLTFDYALHAYQVDRALGAFRASGKLWAYDPLLLAGQPAGVTEDLTSKGTELFVIAMSKLWIHPGFAFNLFIVLVHLGMPAACFVAARLFRLTTIESTVALLLWALLWFFDSFLHMSWWIGMISWSADCYLSVVYVALFYRCLEERRLWQFVVLALLGAALTLIHPFGALTVAVPCLLLYARAFRTLKPLEHALVGCAALAAAATVLVWIGPVLEFRHYVGDADTFFRPGAEYLVFDSFDLVKEWLNTGTPVRTMLRTLCFAAGGVTLWRWKRSGDSRALPLASLILWTVLVSYLAGYTWYGRQTQPYRQIGVAMLAAALPAAVLLRELLAPSALRQLPRSAQLLLGLALLLIIPRFARTVLFYVPELLPKRTENDKPDQSASPLVGFPFEPGPSSMRHEGPPENFQALRYWLLEHHEARGRVAVRDWVLGEYLAASTPIPILGGLPERNVPHVDAHPFRQPDATYEKGGALEQYFERYAVGWVVMNGVNHPLDFRRDLLKPAQKVADFRIYRTRIDPSYFLRGDGSIERQSLNSIRVSAAAGADVVLRFHWLETLRCRPDCALERFEVAGDRVGFIRIPAPPAAFEIYNAYD